VASTEKHLGDVAEIMAGLTGFADKGKYRYSVVQPNSFTDTGLMNEVDVQRRSDELINKQLLSVGDILSKPLVCACGCVGICRHGGIAKHSCC